MDFEERFAKVLEQLTKTMKEQAQEAYKTGIVMVVPGDEIQMLLRERADEHDARATEYRNIDLSRFEGADGAYIEQTALGIERIAKQFRWMAKYVNADHVYRLGEHETRYLWQPPPDIPSSPFGPHVMRRHVSLPPPVS
jgi:hypothetical protein